MQTKAPQYRGARCRSIPCSASAQTLGRAPQGSKAPSCSAQAGSTPRQHRSAIPPVGAALQGRQCAGPLFSRQLEKAFLHQAHNFHSTKLN